MQAREARREILNRFIDLARVYRGWSKTQLAEALGRDPSKLIPDSGNPKLDLVVALANVLDWPVGDVAEAVWIDEDDPGLAAPGEGFDALDRTARDAHRAGDYQHLVQIARQMHERAQTPNERAVACNREAGGWDGLGRYTRVLDVLQRGLQESPIKTDLRLMLSANVANAHYTLWHLLEARATARDLVEQFACAPPANRLQQVTQAFAHYVRGNASRRLIAFEPPRAREHAEAADADLRRAGELYESLCSEYEDDSYGGVASTCRGGLIEVAVELGDQTAEEAVEEIRRTLECGRSVLRGDWLESRGWWSIFGANIALRHLAGRPLHRHVGFFTSRALEVADELDNWAMRERAFTVERFRRKRVADETGFEPDWVMDDDHLRVLAGTMSRFPAFREPGWDILRSARLVGHVGNGNR
jgi:hypothetical protein